MLEFSRKLTFATAMQYAAWRLAKRDEAVRLALRSGPRFELRRNAAGNNDYGVAYEVFVHNYYDDCGRLLSDQVKQIVDLGTNVGFSLLFFLHKYPGARIIGFEPHPGHFDQAKRNLQIDGSRDRVELYNKAAGAANRHLYLSDAGSASSLREPGVAEAIAVDVVDVFPLLLGKQIDLLKIDIEGSEYDILEDPRFEHLAVGSVVMEWHARTGEEDGHWCQQRLQRLGFSIKEIFNKFDHGMFWATQSREGHPARSRPTINPNLPY